MRAMFVGCLFVLAALSACSSEGDILPKRERFAPGVVDAGALQDAAPEGARDIASDGKKPRDPNANCVKPGTPNNDRDIGAYCEPDRGDCASEQGPRFCTADFADLTPIEDDQWFCTTVCTMDDECGTGAICSMGEVGMGCVPFMCLREAGVGNLAALP